MEVLGFTSDGNIEVIIGGARWTIPDDPANRHRQAIATWEAEGNTIPPYVAPPPVVQPVQPVLHAAAAINITDGAISLIEQAAQLSSAAYEDGWVMIGFSEPQDAADYLIFAQTDVPARIEQFKEPSYFELVFSEPGSGDPVNPGRIDIQILKVR